MSEWLWHRMWAIRPAQLYLCLCGALATSLRAAFEHVAEGMDEGATNDPAVRVP